jgi:Domain of unknown function (DUF4139)/N-terminal domain of unknown function (DUF4140)
MKKILVSLLSLVSLTSFGQIKEIQSTAVIENVMVYNSSAEINYSSKVKLPQGTSTVVFTDLTPFIVENTINMSTSSSDVNILTVTEKINYIKKKKKNNSKINELNDSITRITHDFGLLTCKIDAMEAEKRLLFKKGSISGVSKGVQVSEIEKASIFFNDRYTYLSTQLFLLNETSKSYKTNLSRFRNQIKELSKNTTLSGSEIRVTVTNSSIKDVVFNFSFLTDKAGWAPIYDCKYQGSDKPIQFIFRANVFNATGVPWDNIKMKLSTATPTEGFNAPSFGDDQATKSGGAKPVDGVQLIEIQVANSIAEYDIANSYSIPSDSKPYMIDVNSFEMHAEFNYLLIPKLDPYGFLMAKIPDWNKYNLLPGTTNVYNKGSFMGKTFLNTYAENDTLNMYLGKDNNILATRKETTSSNRNNVIGNYYVDKASITITVKNNSTENLKIQILDQVPVIVEGDKAKLNVSNISDALYNKQEGLLTWNVQLAPNTTTSFDYKYELKDPKNNLNSYKRKVVRFRTISCPSF